MVTKGRIRWACPIRETNDKFSPVGLSFQPQRKVRMVLLEDLEDAESFRRCSTREKCAMSAYIPTKRGGVDEQVQSLGSAQLSDCDFALFVIYQRTPPYVLQANRIAASSLRGRIINKIP